MDCISATQGKFARQPSCFLHDSFRQLNLDEICPIGLGVLSNFIKLISGYLADSALAGKGRSSFNESERRTNDRWILREKILNPHRANFLGVTFNLGTGI